MSTKLMLEMLKYWLQYQHAAKHNKSTESSYMHVWSHAGNDGLLGLLAKIVCSICSYTDLADLYKLIYSSSDHAQSTASSNERGACASIRIRRWPSVANAATVAVNCCRYSLQFPSQVLSWVTHQLLGGGKILCQNISTK